MGRLPGVAVSVLVIDGEMEILQERDGVLILFIFCEGRSCFSGKEGLSNKKL